MPVKLTAVQIYAYLEEDWTELTQQTGAIRADWGMDENGPADIIAGVGSLKFTLRNNSGQFYPNGLDPLTDWTKGIPVKVVLTYGETTKVLRYYIEDIQLNVGKVATESNAIITALDWMAFASKNPILAPVIELDKTADQGITTVTTAMTTAPQAESLDTGNSTFPVIFDSTGLRTTAYAEFAKLIYSEAGHLYLIKDTTYGETLVFEKNPPQRAHTGRYNRFRH